jgi:CBS domain-containing protein
MKTAEDILADKGAEVTCVTRDYLVFDAIQIMNRHRIGALLVKEGDQVLGIWTERDLLRNSGDPGFNPKTARVGDYMSAPLHFARHDATLAALKDMFLGLFLRHLPVEKKGRFIGMLSIGDVLRADLLEKDRVIKDLNALASWQYYDNWGWDRKRR